MRRWGLRRSDIGVPRRVVIGRLPSADVEGGVESEVPRVVAAARAVMTGHCRPDEFVAVFAQATVFGVMPDRPGVWAAEIPGRGRWTLVFSTVGRLAAYAGDCQFFSTTGADLLAQLPQGIGLILDPGDDHRVPVLSRMVPPTAS